MNETENRAPFGEGVAANRAGHPLSVNPHIVGTSDRADWIRGWHYAARVDASDALDTSRGNV